MSLCFQLGQNGIHITSRSLHSRRDGVIGTLAPRTGTNLNATYEGFFAQVRTPRPHGNSHVDGCIGGIHTHGSIPAVDNGANIAFFKLVSFNGVDNALGKFVGSIAAGNLGYFASVDQAIHVVFQTKNSTAVLTLITTDAFENARTVVEGMRQNMRCRICPRNELPVLPNKFTFCESGHVGAPFLMSRQ